MNTVHFHEGWTSLPTAVTYIVYVMCVCRYVCMYGSQNGSFNIVTGLQAGQLKIRESFPVVLKDFSLPHKVQTSSGAQPASYPVGIGELFLEGKTAGA
jgi:hypothetical protein